MDDDLKVLVELTEQAKKQKELYEKAVSERNDSIKYYFTKNPEAKANKLAKVLGLSQTMVTVVASGLSSSEYFNKKKRIKGND